MRLNLKKHDRYVRFYQRNRESAPPPIIQHHLRESRTGNCAFAWASLSFWASAITLRWLKYSIYHGHINHIINQGTVNGTHPALRTIMFILLLLRGTCVAFFARLDDTYTIQTCKVCVSCLPAFCAVFTGGYRRLA